MNERNCLSIFGGSKDIMASNFDFVGVTPFGVTLKPNHVVSFYANSHFCGFIASFSSFIFSLFCLIPFCGLVNFLSLSLECRLDMQILYLCFGVFSLLFFEMWLAYPLSRRIRL